MATSERLTQIATDIVVDKVTQDKLRIFEQQTRRQKDQQNAKQQNNQAGESEDASVDDLSHWRERRMQQIKNAKAQRSQLLDAGHGVYEEIVEAEFLPCVTKAKLCVCHFFSSKFERSKIMDKHLAQIAPLHVETKFVKIDAEKTPFFSEKLMIRMLPSVVFFQDGLAVHTLVGFSELGNRDDFKTSQLIRIMRRYNVVNPNPLKDGPSDSDTEDDD